ncbi:MAG: SUMF1/EgtB/PvdO family nonheme iron enzyme [Chlamydiales bacterium]|nr:SUMF1/EgtB/PvdO family nonheme iron enzyme [Chlamydiia bacterium]MCP5507834.1 SUMF1/EgtB/PvdO family nonheme iron enzyme [Chlamydiales bacterium]
MKYALLLLSLLFLPFNTWADDSGTLIVNYNTGPKGERIERIRFRLTDPDGKRSIYPKKNGYVEEKSSQARIVVLENLAAGDYALEFLIPNSDGLFETVPSRIVTITSGKTSKVLQTIKPQYASLTSRADIDASKKPKITLIDKRGDVVAISAAGTLTADNLIPGKYTLQFEKIAGFETPEPRDITLAPYENAGSIVIPYIAEEPITTQSAIDLYDRKPESEIILPKTGERILSYPPSPPNIPTGYIKVHTTLPYAHWTIYRNEEQVVSGEGPAEAIPVPPGDYYTIQADDYDDYDLRLYPRHAFSVNNGESTTIELIYKRTFGYIAVKTDLPSGEMVKIILAPDSGETPIRAAMIARNNKIDWRSKALPTGNYQVSFIPPPHYKNIDPQDVDVEKEQTVLLNPEFVGARQIKINSNTSEAVYTLKALNNGKQWQGKGQSHTFEGLTPGQYTLNFGSNNPERYLAPTSQTLTIPRYSEKDLELSSNYDLAGELVISSNANPFEVKIDGQGTNRTHLEEIIQGRQKNYILPVGRYRITFLPLDSEHITSQATPKPIEVEVNTARSEEVFGDYQPVPTSGKQATVTTDLIIRTNISAGSYTLKSAGDDEEPVEEQYQGKQVTVPLNASKQYIVIFNPVPNYVTPEPIPVILTEGQRQVITGEYKPMQELLTVPNGRSIIGDPYKGNRENVDPATIVNINEFKIAKYEVTNAQLAFWLNDAYQKNQIIYKEGKVTDKDGKLLLKTMEGDSKSQITAAQQGENDPVFQPTPGKAEYPAIFVTWYGANLYATSNGYRLPTEAEWETAAAMEITTPDQPLHKYRYGFSRDTIDRSWANYKASDEPIKSEVVRTTPVGFYNGLHMLPLSQDDTKQWTTRLAQSPVGAFDMSGNVWEWVNDWYSDAYYKHMPVDNPQGPKTGDKKVVKGGCYDSLADGVRVAERMGVPPDYCDQFTGFRIAVSM